MSMNNESNRPSVVVDLGNVTSTKTKVVFHAHKKMRIRTASILQNVAIAADDTDKITLRAQVNGTAVGEDSSSAAGIAARAPFNVNFGSNGYIDLEKGQTLGLTITKGGTAQLTDAILVMDAQVIGN